jgi:hypothetical protein
MSGRTTEAGEQSRETTHDSGRSPAASIRTLRWGANLIAVAGLMFVANGLAMLYRAFFSSGFELGVHALGGVTRAELAGTNHELFHYVNHLHVNVAGLMVAAGIAMIALARYGIGRGHRWALRVRPRSSPPISAHGPPAGIGVLARSAALTPTGAKAG